MQKANKLIESLRFKILKHYSITNPNSQQNIKMLMPLYTQVTNAQ